MSAWVLGIFPPAFAVVLYMIQPDYMSDAVLTTRSASSPSASRPSWPVFGFLWLRKIMTIEV